MASSVLLSHPNLQFRCPNCWSAQRPRIASPTFFLRPVVVGAQSDGKDTDGSRKAAARGGERLWRSELLQQQKHEGPDLWSDESFLSRSVEQDMEEGQQQQKLRKNADERKGFLGSLIEKLLVADFFFIIFILAWFVVGLAEKAAFDTSSLIDAWLPLWPVLFQPALGFFMAGSLWTALSKLWLNR